MNDFFDNLLSFILFAIAIYQIFSHRRRQGKKNTRTKSRKTNQFFQSIEQFSKERRESVREKKPVTNLFEKEIIKKPNLSREKSHSLVKELSREERIALIEEKKEALGTNGTKVTVGDKIEERVQKRKKQEEREHVEERRREKGKSPLEIVEDPLINALILTEVFQSPKGLDE